MSCFIEFEVGVGFTFCLVFCNKFLKGFLVFRGVEGCSVGFRFWGGLGGRSRGFLGFRVSFCLVSVVLVFERVRGNVRIFEGIIVGGFRGCRGLVWVFMGIWLNRLGMERVDRFG